MVIALYVGFTLPGGSTLDREMTARVNSLAQVFAGLEVRDVLSGQRNGFAGFRIAPDSGRSEMQRKAAESAYFNPLAFGQGIAHEVKQVFDRQLYILRREVFLLAGDGFNEFRFCHFFTLRLWPGLVTHRKY